MMLNKIREKFNLSSIDDNNTACKILMTKTELRKSLDFVNEERERLQEELEEEKRINQEDLKLIDELEERIEKAVEYIKKETEDMPVNGCRIRLNEVLEFLNGEDNEKRNKTL